MQKCHIQVLMDADCRFITIQPIEKLLEIIERLRHVLNNRAYHVLNNASRKSRMKYHLRNIRCGHQHNLQIIKNTIA